MGPPHASVAITLDVYGHVIPGLAKAFFYAGSRSLLVSHWPVGSVAAVSLVVGEESRCGTGLVGCYPILTDSDAPPLVAVASRCFRQQYPWSRTPLAQCWRHILD
ncbi:MAG: CHAT domain-containing protein [Rhodospirillales bacterium]|nr:CHAT domain-containing protein [Rhodospirillales bacterium]MDP6883240.1 CHAT domain-containing protein [Rhodospirillales bacterium]